MCTCIYTYIYIYIHTCIHMHIIYVHISVPFLYMSIYTCRCLLLSLHGMYIHIYRLTCREQLRRSKQVWQMLGLANTQFREKSRTRQLWLPSMMSSGGNTKCHGSFMKRLNPVRKPNSNCRVWVCGNLDTVQCKTTWPSWRGKTSDI